MSRLLTPKFLLRGFEFSVEADIFNDTTNRPLTREVDVTPFELNFDDGSRFAIDVTRQYERLDEDFDIFDDIVLSAGQKYEFTRYQVGGSTADHRIVSVNADYAWGRFFSGRRREATVAFTARPRRGLSFTFEAERNFLDLTEGSFATSLYRFFGNTQFTPWVSLANNFQYDTVSRLLGWQLRFRWIRRPGSDLHMVYMHNWREDREDRVRRSSFSTVDSRLAAKVVHTIRF